jgi:hypothetical protein
MKIILIILIILFSSCNINIDDNRRDNIYTEYIEGHKLLIIDYGEYDRIYDISKRIKLISYKASNDNYFPEMTEILIADYIDCKGRAIMAMTILYVEFGIKTDLVLTDLYNSRVIVEGGIVNHAVIKYNNQIFDPIHLGTSIDLAIQYIYYFNDVFSGGIIYK